MNNRKNWKCMEFTKKKIKPAKAPATKWYLLPRNILDIEKKNKVFKFWGKAFTTQN